MAISSIYKEPEAKKFEECIVRKSLSREEISSKLMKLHNKLTYLAEKILDLPQETYSYELNKAKIANCEGEYSEIFLDDNGKEEIYYTEQQIMNDLNNNCRVKLFDLETQFSNTYGVPEHKDTNAFEIEL